MLNIAEAARDPQMNRSLNDPNKKIIVKLIATGHLVALDREKDFNPRYHKRLEGIKVAEPAVVAPVSTEEESVDKKLFDELKLKGWINLSKEEKKVYSELKAKLA